jgi:predicted DNA-binding transcriptional regulator YafY
MTNPATRLITLILLLQRQPGQKAADLAQRLSVSVRTLHRYLAMLDEMGVPVYSERGPQGGFSLVRGYKLPPLVFTPEEASAVMLGAGLVGEMWGQLYREAAQGALAKLENVLPKEQLQEIAWARRALVVVDVNRADLGLLAPRLEKLRQATRENRQVRMTYHSASQPHGVSRLLDPYGLAHRAGWWYVAGYCQLRQAVRTFRLDRIAELSLTEQRFTPPADFDLRAYISQEWQSEAPVQVRLRFEAQYAHIAQYSRGYWESFEEQVDGSIIVAFSASDMQWAVSNVLSYGAAVIALDPPEVRQQVHAAALAISKSYEERNHE